MIKTALFFGSFNPIHYGHIKIAETVLEKGYADEVWFVVSPQNPLKKEITTEGEVRADMVEEEIKIRNLDNHIKVCRTELSMPVPSYTADTIEKIRTENPDKQFSIIIGEDNLRAFHKWKSYKHIAETTEIVVYPRKGGNYTTDTEVDESVKNLPNIKIISDTELLDISSSQIRASQKHLEKGKEYQQKGEMDKALNEYIKSCEENPDNTEAKSRMDMLRSIFEYAYKGHYNP